MVSNGFHIGDFHGFFIWFFYWLREGFFGGKWRVMHWWIGNPLDWETYLRYDNISTYSQ
jgi:hypothetical protein